MAQRNPLVPQVDDDDAKLRFLRRLKVKGPLEELNLADIVVPVSLFGSPGAPDPHFLSQGNTITATVINPIVGQIEVTSPVQNKGRFFFRVLHMSTVAGELLQLTAENLIAVSTRSLALWKTVSVGNVDFEMAFDLFDGDTLQIRSESAALRTDIAYLSFLRLADSIL